MPAINAPGPILDPALQQPAGLREPAAHPPTRRQALGLLGTLVAMFAVIFLLVLTIGATPFSQG